MSQILENLRDFESKSRFWSFSGPQSLIRVRGVVPYDVSRPLCVVGGGAVKIPKIVPAASLGLGEGLGVWERTKPAGRFRLGDGEPGALRGQSLIPSPPLIGQRDSV